MKRAFGKFIQKMYQAPSRCLFKLIKVDEFDYFKKVIEIFEKIFLFWGPMNIRKTGGQNWRWYIFCVNVSIQK